MNIESFLKDNTLLIVPNNLKIKILMMFDKFNELKNIKIMSLEDVLRHLYFDYNEETIFRMMTKYSLKYNISKVYIENMYYIDTYLYDSDKLNDLVLKFRFLLDNNLLIVDGLFKNFLKKRKIVLYGYDFLTKFQDKVVGQLKEITSVEIIKREEVKKHQLDVYQFQTIEEEVEFVFRKIIQLLEKNIDINKIKITGVDDEYYNLIEKLAVFHNLPIPKKKTALYHTFIGNSFIKYIQEGLDFSLVILKLQEMYDKPDEISIINQLVTICNKYAWFKDDKRKIVELLKEDLRNTFIKEQELVNCIKIIDFDLDNFDLDDYVFLVGFNHGKYPVVKRDEDFISDSLKNEVGIDTTIEKNKMAYLKVVDTIYRLPNLTISYKLKTPFETFYPSIIIENEGMNVISDYKIDLSKSYSRLYNKIRLTKYLDQYFKYGSFDDKINILYQNYSDISYLTYDNQFTGIKKEKLKAYLDNKLLLSYSSIDNFYRCQFKYYLSNILKVDKFIETFKITVGNIFHYILSVCFKDDFVFEKEWSFQVSKYQFNSEETFFLKRLKEELILVIDTVKTQHMTSGLTDFLLEEKVYVQKGLEIPTTFMGVIDKLMYKEVDGLTYAAVIDYKTGSVPIDLSNTYYGLSMQLPVYVYLVKHMKKFTNTFIVGFYLQKILHEEIGRDKKKSYLEQKRDLLKLNGYSTDNIRALAYFDPDYENSSMIKSMKTTSKGFSHYTKIITNEEVNNLSSFVDDKIVMAAKAIIDADFKINPKRIDMKPVGCDFCPFGDICYKNENDYVDYKKQDGLDFLGGEACGLD